MITPRLIQVLFLVVGMVTISCSQTVTRNLPEAAKFVGSTPCDSIIKTQLEIPMLGTCEFIKWELDLTTSENDSATFSLKVLYGESQPNTNGFKGGGKMIELSGSYTTSVGIKESTSAKLYLLKPDQLESAIALVELDPNILHFVDKNKDFITGNGGYGYVLNRLIQ